MTRALLALLVVTVAGCRSRDVVLTDHDRALATTTGLPETLLLDIKKAGRNLRQFDARDSTDHPPEIAGVTIDVPHDEALSVVRRLQALAPSGYFAFVSDRSFGFGGDPDHVSVVKAADPYEILRAVGTSGWNYDLSPDTVIARLKEWDRRFGLVFRGIGLDWVEAEFSKQPPDMAAFAQEVYQFCPDVVDQGAETVEALAEEMRRTNILYLWWD